MKPNIVIVMTDQQRASLRKGRGFALDTMPFLDSWAQEGTDFHCAYTSNPTCMPARVSMFSGRYPSATHVRSNANVEDAAQLVGQYDIVTAEVAQKAIPECNIVFIEGAEMKEKLSGYLSVLFEQNAQSVGGALPDDAFYFSR